MAEAGLIGDAKTLIGLYHLARLAETGALNDGVAAPDGGVLIDRGAAPDA
jgi:hypothetical protein